MHARPRMPFTVAVHHLLIGQNGLAFWTPIDRSFLLNGVARFIQPEEYPLGPLVVCGIRGCERVIPIDHQPGPLQLFTETCNICGNQFGRMRVDL
jgi:hypothetical protein